MEGMTWSDRPSPGPTPWTSTVVAVPGYFAAMGLEYWAQRRRQSRGGAPTAGDYEHATLRQPAMGR